MDLKTETSQVSSDKTVQQPYGHKTSTEHYCLSGQRPQRPAAKALGTALLKTTREIAPRSRSSATPYCILPKAPNTARLPPEHQLLPHAGVGRSRHGSPRRSQRPARPPQPLRMGSLRLPAQPRASGRPNDSGASVIPFSPARGPAQEQVHARVGTAASPC